MRRVSASFLGASPETALFQRSLVWLAVCALSWHALSCGGEPSSAAKDPSPSPVYVELMRVEPQTLEHQIALTGQFEAESSVAVKPEIDGVIERIAFDEGARIAKGELLFALRNDEQLARFDLAKAELRLAQDIYERVQRLNSRDISAVAQLTESTAKLDEAKARVALAKVELDRTEIRAPFDGVTGMRHADIGERVDHESILVPFQAIDRLQLIFTIQSSGFGLGRLGDIIHARVFTYPGERFPGEIFFVSPTVDPSTRRMIFKAWVPNLDHRLKPGMFANVDVEIARRENALVLPESAVVYDRNGTYVWRVNPAEQAEKIPVQIGLRQRGTVEIVDGLSEHDVVVVVGTHKVTAGKPLVDVAAAPEAHAVGLPEKAKHPEDKGEAS